MSCGSQILGFTVIHLCLAKNVIRIPWPNPMHADVMAPVVRDVLKEYKNNPGYKHDGYEADHEWDLDFVARMMAGQEAPAASTVRRPSGSAGP